MRYDPNLIVSADNRNSVIGYLVQRGVSEPALHVMTNVRLANLYHEQPNATDVQQATAQAIADTMAALGGRAAGIDEDLVRYLARVEAQALIDAIPQPTTRRLEVVTLRGSVTLDGIQHYRTELVIRIAAIGHAIMLVGPAGCGKTTIGEHTARALQLPFYITSTINDTHELVGFVDGYGQYHRTPFRNAYEAGGVWIADEIDAWDASALLTANSALANGYCSFPDNTTPVPRHSDFRMVATANTFGTGADRIYVGRNELDAASLDRFATINVDYDLQLERAMAGGYDEWLEYVWSIRRSVHEKRIRHVVSTRAVTMGAAALSAGLEWDQVSEIYLFKGMSAKDREKVED